MSALREIIASFGFEVDDKNLKKGERSAEGFKETLIGLGKKLVAAFAIERVIDFSKEILESADVLAKQSIALGVSAAELQGWQFAAQLSGSSAEEFTSAFTKFNKNVAEASAGTGPAADALKALGVTAEDLKTKMPIEVLDGVADGLAGMQDPAKRTQAVMALFGKSGAKLLPLFNEGSEGIAKLRAEVKDLGAEFDESFLADAQEVNDNVDRMKLGFKGLATQALKPLLPLITNFTKGAIGVVKGLVPMIANSNAAKAALVSFGIAGAGALLPLLIELAPLVLGFLALEDALTFLTGGKSLIGDWVDASFGPGSQKKVQDFFASIKDSGITDALMLMKGAFGIFTDGKPLDTKFKELLAFIDGPFKAQMTADFGGVGEQITMWFSLLTSVLGVINQIVDAMKWVGSHTISAIGAATFSADDAAANEDARGAARAANGESSWYDSLRNALVPNAATVKDRLDTATGVPAPRAPVAPIDAQTIHDLFAASVATAQPGFAAAALPASAAPRQEIQQNNSISVVQHITAETPEEISRKSADGAKKGVAAGVNDRAVRALVPVAG